MKKKFIAVYALIGVLALGSTTLTSCVDDNESASVTAVRDAKAAQLNALAALKNAQAEAEKITAEAEAAYKAAETRWQEIQNEMDELKLQAMKDTLETSLKTAQLIAEQNLMAAQEAMEDAKAKLIAALDKVDQANKTRINTLINNADAILNGGTIDGVYYNPTYNEGGANSIVALRNQLLEEEKMLITYNYDLKDAEVFLADKLNEYEETKAYNEALKAKYEELKGTSNRDEIVQQYTEAKADKDAYYQAELTAQETNTLKDNARQDYLNNTINKNEISQAKVALSADYTTTYQNAWLGSISVSGSLASYIGTSINVNSFLTSKTSRDPYKTQITLDNGAIVPLSYSYGGTEEELTEEKSKDLADLISFITNHNTEYQKNTVDVNQKNLNDAIKANEAALAALNKAVTDADAAFKATPNATTEQALLDAKEAVDDFETTHYASDGVTTIFSLRNTLETSQEQLEDMQESLAVVTKIQSLLTGEAMTEYAAQYTEYYTLCEEYFAANAEYEKAQQNYNIATSLVTTLASYVDSGSPSTDLIPDWDDLIAQCDQAIRNAEEDIEKINYTDYDMDGDGTLDDSLNELKQDLIDETEADIERIKIQIEQQEAQYDSYMQQAQELIENGSTIPDVEVPETPSEGEGTDTPAEETPAE